MTFNQLKLNSNTVIDGLNLVNVVQRPQPIVIENVNSRRTHSPPTRDNDFRNRSDFEVIDENKLSMYSYLVKREMKTKEWLSKFHLDHPNHPSHQNIEMKSNISTTNKKPITTTMTTKKRIMFNDESKKTNTNRQSPSRLSRINSTSKTSNELEELKSCCDETIKSIEYLEQKLSEFKYERLKIVLNDPVEEEKQKRIQLGQLKHLSRIVYNSQIQLKKFKPQLKRSPSPTAQNTSKLAAAAAASSSSKSLTPIGRLIHTMRLVNKSIHAFAEYYPYRPDNDIRSERLCFHFYKQAHLCVENFNRCILNVLVFTNVLGDNGRNTAKRLIELLGNCDQYFEEFLNEVDESSSKALVKYAPPTSETSKKITEGRVVNVVRVPRTRPTSQVVDTSRVVAVPTQTFVDGGKNKPLWNNVSDTRIELSPSRKAKKDVFKKKKVKTATLYPSRVNNKNQIKKLTIQTVQKDIPKEVTSRSNLNTSIESIQQQQRKSPIEHISSPVLNRKVTLVNRSRSAESPQRRQTQQRHYTSDRSRSESRNREYHPDESLESIYSEGRSPVRRPILKKGGAGGQANRSMFEYSPSSSLFRPISRNTRSPSRPTTKSRSFLTRLNMIKNENEMIRKKYENLAYDQHLVEKFSENSRIRRPYEECYAKIDGDEIEKREKEELYYNKVYKPLRHGTLDQLRRVVNYAERFADYNEKTSITKIGESEFDDFELFEKLSKEIFGECLNEVCDELDLINSEIATNLVNGEFATENGEGGDLSRRLLSLSSMRSSMQTSPTRTSISTRQQQQQQHTHKDRSSINSNYDDESFISTTES